jgi:hypothetical protein
MTRKGSSFKNIKLGKNVYRQMKRRAAPEYPPPKRQYPKPPQKSNS